MPDFKGVIFSKTENEDLSHEDKWDDSLLIRQYDAVKAKLEKKRRERKCSETSGTETDYSAVMLTEQAPNLLQPEAGLQNLNKSKKKQKRKKGKKKEWQIGDFCRWRYSEDGKIYEATIAEMDVTAGTCTICYIGYNNEEVVTTRHLQKSLGEKSRQKQAKEAELAGYGSNNDSMFGDGSSVTGSDMVSDRDNERSSKRKRKTPTGTLPRMPHLPELPPPPALGLCGDRNSEALHTMLMSWYMTGYHTGYYQGLQASKAKI